MIQPLIPGLATGAAAPASQPNAEAAALGQRFEQLLWAEMLSHAGLEDAFTKGGGEAASAFSRYIVEAIAEDLAAKHPLGFGDQVMAKAAPLPGPTEREE